MIGNINDWGWLLCVVHVLDWALKTSSTRTSNKKVVTFSFTSICSVLQYYYYPSQVIFSLLLYSIIISGRFFFLFRPPVAHHAPQVAGNTTLIVQSYRLFSSIHLLRLASDHLVSIFDRKNVYVYRILVEYVLCYKISRRAALSWAARAVCA